MLIYFLHVESIGFMVLRWWILLGKRIRLSLGVRVELEIYMVSSCNPNKSRQIGTHCQSSKRIGLYLFETWYTSLYLLVGVIIYVKSLCWSLIIKMRLTTLETLLFLIWTWTCVFVLLCALCFMYFWFFFWEKKVVFFNDLPQNNYT